MSNPIIVNFTAINRKGSDSYQATFSIETKEELAKAVQQFEKDCTFRKFDMETEAEHANGKALTAKERLWFEEQDDIGFF